MKLLGDTLGDHPKRRCNDFLAIMYLMMIADPDENKMNAALAELSPAFIEQVKAINESAGDMSRESNQIVNALSILFVSYSKALEADALGYGAPGGKSNRMLFEEKYLVEFDTDGCLRDVLARELFSALSRVSRDYCLSFGYRSVQQFAQRFTNDSKVIEDSGFEIVTNAHYKEDTNQSMKDLTKWTSDCEVRNLDECRTWLDFCIEKLLGGLAAGKAALELATDSDDNGIANRDELDSLPDDWPCSECGIDKDAFGVVAS